MRSRYYTKIPAIALLFFLTLLPLSPSESGPVPKGKDAGENLETINPLLIAFLENGGRLEYVKAGDEGIHTDIFRELMSGAKDYTLPGPEEPVILDRAQELARVSFDGLWRSYFAGDNITVAVSMEPVTGEGRADLYATAGTPGLPDVLYFTGDSHMPFSELPTPVQSDIPIASGSYEVFQSVTPSLPFGLAIDLSAYLVEPGAEPIGENIVSNVAEARTRLIGSTQNEQDRNQSNVLRTLKRLASPDIFRAEVRKGVVRRLDLNLSIPRFLFPAGSTSDDVAQAILSISEQLLRVETPRKSLRLIKRAGDTVHTLTFRQYYRDVPVLGAWFQMTIEEKENAFILRDMSGKYTPDLKVEQLEPEISAQQAMLSVMQEYNMNSLGELRMAVPVKLWIFDEALFAPECPRCSEVAHNPRLAWRVVFNSPREGGALADAYVDAVNGDLLFHQARTDGADIRIYTATNHTIETCGSEAWEEGIQAWFDEDGVCESRHRCDYRNRCGPWAGPICADPDAEGDSTFDYTWLIYNFYWDVFRQRSYHETQDRIMNMYIDVSFAPEADNAFSTDCLIADIHKFSDGWATLDVMAHEVGHSFHRSAVRYEYSHQSGAIAEHIADMFGHFVGYWSTLDTNWLQGEGRPGGPSRNMADPPLLGDPDHFVDYTPGPGDRAHDYGWVHSNSTILSKAGYLMTAGDTHNGITVRGIGDAKARQIYYWLVRAYLGDNPSFTTFANHIQDACRELIGYRGITDNDCCQVRNALASVGLETSDADCDGVSDDVEWDDDDDGVADATDNCLFLPNPSQRDTDGDGLGDACDPDADNDGYDNEDDNCPYAANDQSDWDDNGVGDACDDSDGDQIADSLDNCPDDRNRNQADQDGDGIGDECDDDIDGDSIANSSDNCPTVANISQSDTDSDGVGNSCDNCIAVANALQEDIDGDGLGDVCDDDIDGDGILNEDDNCPDEYTAMTDICIAPAGYACREYGCPLGRLLPDAEVNMHFNWGHLSHAHPAFIRPMFGTYLNPCELIDCQAQNLFEDNEYLQVTVDLYLDLPTDLQMEFPVILALAVLNEAGHRVAAGEAYFVSADETGLAEQRSGQVTLSFKMLPSFTWRDSGQLSFRDDVSRRQSYNVEADAALPAYHLILVPRNLSQANRQILSSIPLKFSYQIILTHQEQ